MSIDNNGKLILVSLDAANWFRDEGMRFAYWKSAVIGLMLMANLFFALAAGLYLYAPGWEIALLVCLLMAFVSLVAMAWCNKSAEFPQCVRMTREELDTMRDDMGIPADVFQRTHDNVIHGSRMDFRADEQVEKVVRRARFSSLGGSEQATQGKR